MTSPFVAPDIDAPRLSHIVGSPVGRLLLTGDGHALTGLWMLDALISAVTRLAWRKG